MSSYCIRTGTIKGPDSQMLFNPFEKDFHLPSVIEMKVGMFPRRSKRVCILATALCLRNLAHGNMDTQRSILDASYKTLAVLIST